MKKKLQKWTLAFAGIGTIIGGFIGQFIIYLRDGKMNLGSISGFLTAGIIVIIINVVQNYRKNDLLPEIDERTRYNELKFHAITPHIIFALLFTLLGIASYIEIEHIPTIYLWIIAITYMFVIGIGALIVRKR
ncbi:hypothetical protein [Alkalibacillus haloalkaliphilus]|uniref:hypothetical protein n=1 Tax=Alkalibacillus haloalkaliphilus TaxID=94136 RepID=UPI0003086D9E|nr:hypothetical protein [Alkalibacillus haloalkaliphilus]